MMGQQTERISLPQGLVDELRNRAEANSVPVAEYLQRILTRVTPTETLHGDVVGELEQLMREKTVLEQELEAANEARAYLNAHGIDQQVKLRAATERVAELEATSTAVSNALGRALGMLWAPLLVEEEARA